MAQNDAFVDLSYRGLSLGRRIKLTQVRPSTGYLEHPTPMPVGTPVSIATDDGIVIEAVVTHVHEQVGGSEKAPGMTVKPALADQKLSAWWTERVTMPELESKPRPPERSRPVTVRPRTHTVPNPVASIDTGNGGVAVPEAARVEVTLPMPSPPPPPPSVIPMATPPAMTTPPALARIELVKAERPDTVVEDNKKTMLMDAVDQELLEQLSRGSGDIERLVRTTNEHPVVDDGQRTIVMDAVDPSALGLEVSASGSMPAMDSGEIEDETNGEDDTSQPVSAANGDKKSSGVKKRRKKRR